MGRGVDCAAAERAVLEPRTPRRHLGEVGVDELAADERSRPEVLAVPVDTPEGLTLGHLCRHVGPSARHIPPDWSAPSSKLGGATGPATATLPGAMTNPTPAPTARGDARPRLPAVLRDEPQYRLLFTGQVLSILGDRVTGVVLPFAVLAVGGDVGDVAIVSAAQFLPFAVLALPAGVWADRYNRKLILDRVRRGPVRRPAHRGPAAGHRVGRDRPPRRARRRLRRCGRVLRPGLHRAAARHRRPGEPPARQRACAA